jgi:hypothetical protein
MKDDFYIGYLPKAPKSISKMVKRAVIAFGILVIILGVVIAQNQQNLQPNTFEFGKITELTGVLQQHPVPNLIIHHGKNAKGDDLYQSVLLIGLGKFGADSLVQHFKKDINTPLENTLITLRGTLIYTDGKTLLELTEEEKSFVKAEPLSTPYTIPTLEKKPIQEVKGEIVDSKCYFGVMNPGYGKPHRSCAIRCISGGIPPVIWSNLPDGSSDYYILLDKNGKAVNKEILPHVADRSCVNGEMVVYFDWKILYADFEEGVRTLSCTSR